MSPTDERGEDRTSASEDRTSTSDDRTRAGDDHWLVRPSTIRRLWIVFAVVLAATVVPDLFLHPHADFGIDGTPGFYAWYGFVTCVAMVLFAKGLSVFLKRSDRYYDD